ncbi:protein of unknown function [Micrococcales bacterium KH10]|nr:protein of unknown function [Micrococcales bacterium KH10]
MPKRVQMTRQRPWRADNPDAVIVARPSKWGNPWRVWRDARRGRWVCKADHNASYELFITKDEATAAAVEHFRHWVWRLDVTELAGKDLACWCPLDQSCHADVLLEIANGGAQ